MENTDEYFIILKHLHCLAEELAFDLFGALKKVITPQGV